jgi:hypothetical protein
MVRGGEDASAAVDVDLYGVLGLNKECSDADLRLAYRKLAMVSSRISPSASSCDDVQAINL